MKLAGNVHVTHRLDPSACAHRPRWANLAIGKDQSSGELYLSCHSTLTNSKYKILGNIEQVFMKFVGKGLATIRFREPADDLSINCKDNIESLKAFLSALRLALQNKPLTVPLSSLLPTGPIVQKAKTSLTITKRSAYPVTTGFPNMLEALSVHIQMERFDRRIVNLTHLKILNLSDNCISVLPEELGELPSLATLVLSGNRLGKATEEFDIWNWMESRQMSSNLRHLDIGSNKLEQLPTCLGNLKSLVTLKLDGNSLTSLPHVISTFTKLKYLGAGGNKLSYLPGSLIRLRLEYIDISANPFVTSVADPVMPDEDALSEPPSLFEAAARTILDKRLLYLKSQIPKILRNYLNTPKICSCGLACFESCISIISTIDLKKVSPTVMSDDSISVSLVPAEILFCSKKCFTYTWLKKALPQPRHRTGIDPHRRFDLRLQKRLHDETCRLNKSRRTRRDNIVTPSMNEFIELYKS